MITLRPRAVAAIREFLAGREAGKAVRVAIHSTGCCDPSLGLELDQVRDDDLIQSADGPTLVISPETSALVGQVTVDHVNDDQRHGFVLTSAKPLSEWEGFGVCQIRD